MPAPPATIRCLNCGKSWTARKKVTSKPRQCPKCFGREVEERQDDEAGGVKMSDSPPAYDENDDPEVREKLKELRLAELDKKIQDVKGSPSGSIAERIFMNHINLLWQLYEDKVISRDNYDSLSSSCPWCGVEGDDGIDYHEYQNGGHLVQEYRCASCKHRVSI